MPINLIIRPTIFEHDLKVLSRLLAEFDHKIENQDSLAPKEIIAQRLEFLSHNPAFSLLRRMRQPDEKITDLLS
jgi:hypothetical protein